MTNEQIARVAHQLNKAYCEAIGDNSQVNWEDAPEWHCLGVIDEVDFYITNNPNVRTEHSHNPEKKDRPCTLPDDELATEYRAKDYLFRAVVHELI